MEPLPSSPGPAAPPRAWLPVRGPRSLRATVADAVTLDLRSLALFRILVGVILLLDALTRLTRFGRLMGREGFLPPDLVREYVGHPWSWSLALWSDAEPWNLAVLTLEALAGAVLAAGIHTTVATGLAWIAVVSVVRRTAPATNAGDVLLACLLFWSLWLPLGARWSWDARRHPDRRWSNGLRSPAAAAFVLQVAGVYLSAGLAKCNATWWSGDAVSYALSLHDHGTPWGDVIAGSPTIARLLTWTALAFELAGPWLLLVRAARVPLVAAFFIFHLSIFLVLDVCLFPWVGMAAWLALLPASAWNRGQPEVTARPPLPVGRWRGIGAVVGMVVALVAFLHANGPWRTVRLPTGIRRAVQLTFLEQDWSVFGDVRRQRQWVYAAAELADGSLVDLLRGGRPVETVLPAGGYHGIGDQRLQKLLWELPKPAQRPFAASVAGVLARDWNASHPPEHQAISVELHGARLMDEPEPGTLQDVLLATWPPRSRGGRGALDRFLREADALLPGTPAGPEPLPPTAAPAAGPGG